MKLSRHTARILIIRKTIFAILMVVCGTLHAQKFGGGFYAGLTTSQIDGDGLGGFDLPGFQAGFLTDMRLGENSELQLELAFIQKGARQVPDTNNNGVHYKARLNYIEIPLLYQFEWNYLSFEIGPALDISIGEKEVSNYTEVREIDPPFIPLSLTGIVGFNFHFSESFYLNMRSNISVTPVRRGFAGLGVPLRPRLGGHGWRNVVLSAALVYDFGED